jgi:hypothetical protein
MLDKGDRVCRKREEREKLELILVVDRKLGDF